jgi:flagella basal body P-ring formation protein FlgA
MNPLHPTLNTLNLLIAGTILLYGNLGGASQAAVVSEALIRNKVTAHVQDKIQSLISKADRQYVTVQVLKVPSAPFDFPTATKTDDIKISTESPLGGVYSERSVIRVQMSTEDGSNREIGVPVQIVIKKPVWVVKNNINANEPLRASDFSLETRDVSHGYSYAVGPEKDLNLYIARVHLRPGDILDARKLVIPPDVTCNDEIQILITNESGMTITVPGIALSNGRVGENIRVRQTVYFRKYYSAKIIDKNRVLVEI